MEYMKSFNPNVCLPQAKTRFTGLPLEQLPTEENLDNNESS